MKFSPQLLFIFFVQTCSVYSKAFSVPCDNSFNVTSDADNYRSLLQSEDSIIYDLTNVVTEADIDFDLSRCRQELMVIKEGIRKKDAWTFKRKCSILSVINKQIVKTLSKDFRKLLCFCFATLRALQRSRIRYGHVDVCCKDVWKREFHRRMLNSRSEMWKTQICMKFCSGD